MGAPPHGSVFIPQSCAPQVGGTQHCPAEVQTAVGPSLAQVFPVQLTGTPVHGSAFMPQSWAPHVTGTQQAPASHVSLALPQLHVTGLPHESFFAPHMAPLQGDTHVHSLFTHSCP